MKAILAIVVIALLSLGHSMKSSETDLEKYRSDAVAMCCYEILMSNNTPSPTPVPGPAPVPNPGSKPSPVLQPPVKKAAVTAPVVLTSLAKSDTVPDCKDGRCEFIDKQTKQGGMLCDCKSCDCIACQCQLAGVDGPTPANKKENSVAKPDEKAVVKKEQPIVATPSYVQYRGRWYIHPK